jgi:LysR family glycine cleavage system transcriptional activator
VRGLEEWLGIRLFKASGRSRRLTSAGESLGSTLTHAFDQIELACRSLTRSSRARELHLNVTPTFAIRWLVPRLGRFQALHPEISVHIATSAKPIELERDMHAALRFGKPPWPGAMADLVFMEDAFAVCHPKLLAGRHKLCSPLALRRHTLLHTIYRRNDRARWLQAAGLGNSEVDPSEGLTFDLTTMAIDAAEAGLGVAITREAQVSDVLKSGGWLLLFGATCCAERDAT